jgi:hypothetical protein
MSGRRGALRLILPHTCSKDCSGLHEPTADQRLQPTGADAELNRLQRFDDRLSKFDPAVAPAIDRPGILQTAVKRDLFEMQDMSVFERNPMVYARAADVNVYQKKFCAAEDRVRSLVAISANPKHSHCGKDELNETLPNHL